MNLLDTLIKINNRNLILRSQLIEDFSENDFKDYFLSKISYINLVSEQPVHIQGYYNLISEDEVDLKVLEIQLDLNKAYVYYEIGHSGEWKFYEVDSFSDAKGLVNDNEFLASMFVSTLAIVNNGEVIYIDDKN